MAFRPGKEAGPGATREGCAWLIGLRLRRSDAGLDRLNRRKNKPIPVGEKLLKTSFSKRQFPAWSFTVLRLAKVSFLLVVEQHGSKS